MVGGVARAHKLAMELVLAVCDGWSPMLMEEALGTNRHHDRHRPEPWEYYATPGTKVESLVPNYCKLGTKKFTTWCQSCNPLVPKFKLGTKVVRYQSLSLVPKLSKVVPNV